MASQSKPARRRKSPVSVHRVGGIEITKTTNRRTFLRLIRRGRSKEIMNEDFWKKYDPINSSLRKPAGKGKPYRGTIYRDKREGLSVQHAILHLFQHKLLVEARIHLNPHSRLAYLSELLFELTRTNRHRSATEERENQLVDLRAALNGRPSLVERDSRWSLFIASAYPDRRYLRRVLADATKDAEVVGAFRQLNRIEEEQLEVATTPLRFRTAHQKVNQSELVLLNYLLRRAPIEV